MNVFVCIVDLFVDVYVFIVVCYCMIDVDGVCVFYCEVGFVDVLIVLLLYGFFSVLYMFCNLILQLVVCYYVVVLDFFGFGLMQVLSGFCYMFDNFVYVVDGFMQVIGLLWYVIYVFDYGVLVGWCLVMVYLECISVIVMQNGNGYEEGLGEGLWVLIKVYWNNLDEVYCCKLYVIVLDEMMQW